MYGRKGGNGAGKGNFFKFSCALISHVCLNWFSMMTYLKFIFAFFCSTCGLLDQHPVQDLIAVADDNNRLRARYSDMLRNHFVESLFRVELPNVVQLNQHVR